MFLILNSDAVKNGLDTSDIIDQLTIYLSNFKLDTFIGLLIDHNTFCAVWYIKNFYHLLGIVKSITIIT